MKKVVLRRRPETNTFEKDIKSIFSFTNVIEIYEEFCTKSELDALSEDYKAWLTCANDYNPIQFFVINGDTVITTDDMNGSFCGVQTLTKFFSDNLKYYKEEYEPF